MNKYSLLLLLLFNINSALSQEVRFNYVKSSTLVSDSDTLVTYRYVDGLGRPYETVKVKYTNQGNDLVDFQEYDMKGRVSKTWLPISVPSNSAPLQPEAFSSMAQKQYSDSCPFSSYIYESSPLNRELKLYGAGEAWRTAESSVGTEYLSNAREEVLSFEFIENGQVETLHTGYYAPGALSKTCTYDENGNLTIATYTDVLGHVVCIENGTQKSYRVYDVAGNLRCVIPSALGKTLNPGRLYELSLPTFSQYAYCYAYDDRNRCVKKKLPGCEPVTMVYDNSNRIVFLQDGNQRAMGKWRVNLYDKFGRMVVDGECVMTILPNISNKTVVATYGGLEILGGYSVNLDLPLVDLIKVNYYDDYHFLEILGEKMKGCLSFVEKKDYGLDLRCAEKAMTAQGLLTGSRVYLLDSSTSFSAQAFYYDERERLIQTHCSNFLGGIESTYYSLNYYTGRVYRKLVEHASETSTIKKISELYQYTYDKSGRLINSYHTLDDGERIMFSHIYYDEYDRIRFMMNSKILELATTYTYNIRGWLIEQKNSLSCQKMYYNELRDGEKSIAQWNGNLSSYTVGSSSYDYFYDSDNRIVGAYSEDKIDSKVQDGLHNCLYAYDDMGNILSLERWGVNSESGEKGKRDDVLFEYNGNQLSKVTNKGYKDSSYDMQVADKVSLSGAEYEYDANGNMTKDANKGIYKIRYNVLNLPEDIFSQNGNWHYSYDGNGNKVAVYAQTLNTPVVIPSSQIMERHFSDEELMVSSRQMQCSYVGECVYEFSSESGMMELVRLNIPNGYVSFSQNKSTYNFYVKDFLGNNRFVVRSPRTKIQVNNYYPFGGLYNVKSNEDSQRWRYGDKELDRSFDLCDFIARWYDPMHGRFIMVDPMAEKYPWLSPYVYCADNPINAFDPNGQHLVYSYVNQSNDTIRYCYKSDKDGIYDFYDKSGNKFEYDDSFYKQLKNALDELRSKAYGSILVNELIESTNGIYIKKSSDGDNHANPNRVEWNPNNKIGGLDTNGSRNRDAFIGLGHELAHMYDPNVNKFSEVWLDYNGTIIYEGEKYATYWENLLRSEHGVPLRKFYVDDESGTYNKTILIDSENRNLFYDSKVEKIGDKQIIKIIKK